jgi:hypothetical protein
MALRLVYRLKIRGNMPSSNSAKLSVVKAIIQGTGRIHQFAAVGRKAVDIRFRIGAEAQKTLIEPVKSLCGSRVISASILLFTDLQFHLLQLLNKFGLAFL